MSLRRIGVLLGKELAHGTRNFIFIFATVIPVMVSLILSLVFGRLLSDHPRLGLIDQGDSRLTTLFMSHEYVDARRYESPQQLRRDVERGAVQLGLIIPAGFDAAVRGSEATDLTIWFWGEGLIADRAALVTALAKNVIEVSGRDVPVSVEPILLGQGEIASWADRLLPLLVLMTIILGGTLVPAVSLVDEKQKRTLGALTITPTSLGEVLASKALLGMGLSLAMGVLILILNRAWGTQPALLVLVLALGALAAAAFGILLGLIAKDINTLFTVIKSLAILLYAPAIIDLVPQLPGWLARIFPTYYIIAPIQEIALNGAVLSDIIGQLAILIVLIALLIIGLAALVRGQQRRQAWAGV
jgi:ABC-2 type transport system permease protein